jgi:hypothetical protein
LKLETVLKYCALVFHYKYAAGLSEIDKVYFFYISNIDGKILKSKEKVLKTIK